MIPKTLFVSWKLPPEPAAVAFVTANLARGFSANEMVLAGGGSRAGSCEAAAPGLPPIYYLGKDWGFWRLYRLLGWLRWLRVPGTALRLARLAKRENCCTILATYPSDFFLLAAYLAARWANLRFVPYFHNTYAEVMETVGGVNRMIANWLQPRAFAAADTVLVISEGMKDHWSKKYPATQFAALTHSFNGPLPNFTALPAVARPVRLAFMGTFGSANAEAMRRVVALLNAEPESWRLTVYSPVAVRTLERQGVTGTAVYYDQASDEELISKLSAHDVLLLPHGFTGSFPKAEYDTIFPTRTISYLLAMRPILAHAPSDCFLTRWLRQYDCAQIVDTPDPAALRAALIRLRDDTKRREELVRNGLKAVQVFHAECVVGVLRKHLFARGPNGVSKTDRTNTCARDVGQARPTAQK